MKCLFVTAREATDHLASCLWDGLQEVLGEENVVDAVGHRLLHNYTCGETEWQGETGDSRFGSKDVLGGISGRRHGRHLVDSEERFDLLVLNAAFLREFDWSWADPWVNRLNRGGKIAYVEGWDSAHEVHKPPIAVDAVFRKEIDPSFSYPYDCHHLTFAAPARWFHSEDETRERPFDVFYSGTTHSNAIRWATLAAVFQSRQHHKSIVSSKHMGVSVPAYFNYYRQSKLALCPASAEGADSLRTYEAVACGAIPLFVGYPSWRREEWFGGKIFQCSRPDEVAAHIDAALDRDLPAMRRELLAFARQHHTTRARAEKLLRLTEIL